MPWTKIFFFKDEFGLIPAAEFLRGLKPAVRLKASMRLRLLETQGFELRRPYGDYLDRGIYELRFRHRTTQYRLLYFFHGRNVVVVSHGFTKEAEVPEFDIALAAKRMKIYQSKPEKYAEEWNYE